MQIKAIRTRIFKENEILLDFILKYISTVKEGDIVVVTSKIVALSEGRTVFCNSEKEKEKIIRSESEFALKTKLVWVTIKDGTVMASAGVDESNADGKIILLPKDSFAFAQMLHTKLKKFYKVKNLGIIISDSGLLPLRAGVIGVAVGYAGFKGVKDYVGKKDIFGRVLKFSRTDMADSLATSAVLLMGEGSEQQPLALIEDAPVLFTNKTNKKEINFNIKEDIFYPLFKNAFYGKKK